MKKGCLFVVVVLIALSIAGALAVKSFIDKAKIVFEGLEEISTTIVENTTELNSQYPFNEPKKLGLIDQQTTSFFSVRRQMNDTISGTDFFRNMKKFEDMEASGQEPSFTDFSDMISSIVPSITDITDKFFLYLNEQKLSPAEYYYVSNIVLATIGWELEKGNLKEQIDPEFSRSIREMLLKAEEMDSTVYQVKTKLTELPDEDYDTILNTIKSHLAEFNQIRNSYYFDNFISRISISHDENVE